MEKSWRLQRYHRKDYTELVEFPVEIVGRDGVVRRYTFEDSIRLYRRRITFAPIRYRDMDLIQAEVDHCRSRIDQLRRSYFYRYGWGTPEGQPAPVEIFGNLAGELAAFLCKVLRVEGRPEVRFEPVPAEVAPGDFHPDSPPSSSPAIDPRAHADADVSTWYVIPKDYPNGMLLYVHRFSAAHELGTHAAPADGAPPPPPPPPIEPPPEIPLGDPRDRFFDMLKRLERAQAGVPATNGADADPAGGDGDEERLLAFHHTVDCGFVLTARGADVEAFQVQLDEDEEIGAIEPTPWDETLDVIRRGHYADGLARCRTLVTEQPWHRNAYVAGAVLALHLEQPLVAEDFALVGSRYFPTDAPLAYYLGLARARQGRRREALVPLNTALVEQPGLACARLLLAVMCLDLGQHRDARRALAGREGVRPDDRRAEASMYRLEQWMFWRRVMVGTGYASAALGLLATGLAGWFGLVPVLLGLAMAGTGMYAFRRELDRIAAWQRFEDVNQGLRRLRRTPAEDRKIS